MNKSEVLRALEWVDQAAREGDREVMLKAKLALDNELSSKQNTRTPKEAYTNAHESFVRKHGREPLETIVDDSETEEYQT